MARSSVNGKQLLVLLLILCAGLGWNYKRNADVENQYPRPYRGYSDGELEQLMAAQESETKRRTTIKKSGTQKVTVRDRSLLGDRIDEFERVRQASAKQRALSSSVADSEASIQLIRSELESREKDRPAYKMIMRRTFTFRPI